MLYNQAQNTPESDWIYNQPPYRIPYESVDSIYHIAFFAVVFDIIGFGAAVALTISNTINLCCERFLCCRDDYVQLDTMESGDENRVSIFFT